MYDYRVIRTAHNGREPLHFRLQRPGGTDDYLLLHFQTPVVFTLYDQTQPITPGTCILLSPGTPHAFSPDGTELVHDWMHFWPSDSSHFHALQFPMNTFFRPSDTASITASVKQCEHELIYRGEGYEAMIASHVAALLIRLKRELSAPSDSPHAAALKALRLSIYSHPDRYATTADMAASVHLSRSRFAVVYHELFRIPPKSDLIAARISKASHLLSLGTLTLGEISDICGYQSIYHFIRQFRTVKGVTPGEYRKTT